MRLALPNLRPIFVRAAIAGGALLLALILAQIYAEQPLVALAVPGVLLVAILCARWPALAVLVLLVLVGATGSLEAFFGIPSGPVMDVVFAGLWISVLFAYVVK